MEFKYFNLAEAINNGQNLAMNRQKLDDLASMMQAKEGLRQAVSTGTPEAMDLYRKQFPVEARQWDAGNVQLNSAQIKNALDRVEYVGQLASGVSDEESYQRAIGEARRALGDDVVRDAPKNYDPRWVQQTIMQALTVKDRLAMMAKDTKAPETRQVLIGRETVTQEFDPSTRTWKEVGRGVKAPLVQVDTGTKEADKEFIKETRENFSRLRDAPTALKNIEEAKALIPQSSAFMGTGGGKMLEAVKLLNNRLGFQINTEGVKSAEELRSRVFFQILENLKKMDASPSQKQQEVMMEALGNLDTDPNALSSILDAFGDAVRDKVNTHNSIVMDAEKRGTKFPHGVTIQLPPRSQGKTPSGPIGAPKQVGSNVGDVVTSRDGKQYRIIGLSPDGDHEIELVQ